ncbi:ribonuclease III [Quadrisphaera sp. KR29]|uniref:ribonuclease III n=1 Tax=Quadrisphaera sp. KR29 TaxID=3461391 RepID=UPI004044E71F
MTARRRRPVEPPRDQVHARLLEQLGLEVEVELLERALVHRSWSYENGGVPTNERLEFLGDAVLGLVVTDELFHRHPDLPEGRLAKLRSAVVNMRALASVARGLDLGSAVRLGRGEETTGGRDKDSILADTTEAVIGAAYLSCGPDAARELVLRLVGPLLEVSAELGAGLDWKTSLQELGAAHGLGPVEYLVTEEGPDHAKTFAAVATFPEAPADDPLGAVPRGAGAGRSKKEAEQEAAASAWRALHAERGATPAGQPVAQDA